MTTLIIHHWDADGICSAGIIAQVLDYLGEPWRNVTPPIGIFDFDSRIWREIANASDVFIVDLNVPELVKRIEKKVTFIDHHIQERIDLPNVEHVNPVIGGKSEKEYPSASWVVSEYYSTWNHLSALGALGDVGRRVFDWDVGRKVIQLLLESGLSRRDATKLVSLIDSNYMVMSRDGVEKAVKMVVEMEPRDLLEEEEWIKNLSVVEREIWRALSNVEIRRGYAFIEFKSGLNIISKVARRAVWIMGYDVVLAVNRGFGDRGQIYLRVKPGSGVNVARIIRELKVRGFNAGGKRDVLGVVCPREKIDDALSVIEGLI